MRQNLKFFKISTKATGQNFNKGDETKFKKFQNFNKGDETKF